VPLISNVKLVSLSERSLMEWLTRTPSSLSSTSYSHYKSESKLCLMSPISSFLDRVSCQPPFILVRSRLIRASMIQSVFTRICCSPAALNGTRASKVLLCMIII
ncbi:hypothetical protein PENTCL1PPCAC_8020, partial [Pristionchus entomophagus]